ncbi:MAG: protein kinase family protein [Parachlamydiales bacterium]
MDWTLGHYTFEIDGSEKSKVYRKVKECAQKQWNCQLPQTYADVALCFGKGKGKKVAVWLSLEGTGDGGLIMRSSHKSFKVKSSGYRENQVVAIDQFLGRKADPNLLQQLKSSTVPELVSPNGLLVGTRGDGGLIVVDRKQEIGSGGFKTVYRALEVDALGNQKIWAGKVVGEKPTQGSKAKQARTNARDNARQEDKVVEEIDSDHVIGKSDFVCQTADDDPLLLFLEPLAKGDLERVAKDSFLTTGGLRTWMGEMAQGVEDVHSKGYAHRDIKPENFLVSWDGKHVKLADFGTAVKADEIMLEVVWWIGTKQYWPAEHESTVQDQRADIYALGKTYDALLKAAAKKNPPIGKRGDFKRLNGIAAKMMEQAYAENAPTLSHWKKEINK